MSKVGGEIRPMFMSHGKLYTVANRASICLDYKVTAANSTHSLTFGKYNDSLLCQERNEKIEIALITIHKICSYCQETASLA